MCVFRERDKRVEQKGIGAGKNNRAGSIVSACGSIKGAGAKEQQREAAEKEISAASRRLTTTEDSDDFKGRGLHPFGPILGLFQLQFQFSLSLDENQRLVLKPNFKV